MLHHSLVTGDETDDFGATPVHDAAEQGQLESLQVFFEHSVNMEVPDCDGLTPKYSCYSNYFSHVITSKAVANQNIMFISFVAMYLLSHIYTEWFLVVLVDYSELTPLLLLCTCNSKIGRAISFCLKIKHA